MKNLYVSLGVSIGIPAGLLCGLATILGDQLTAGAIPKDIALTAWPAFISWALYYAIGGKPSGMGKVMAANTEGALVAMLIVALLTPFAGMGAALSLTIAVIIGGFLMCAVANWNVLSFVPGAFCGCASAFGFGVGLDFHSLIQLLLSMYVGAVLGWLSELWGVAQMSKSWKEAQKTDAA
jgi:hypothetical protein